VFDSDWVLAVVGLVLVGRLFLKGEFGSGGVNVDHGEDSGDNGDFDEEDADNNDGENLDIDEDVDANEKRAKKKVNSASRIARFYDPFLHTPHVPTFLRTVPAMVALLAGVASIGASAGRGFEVGGALPSRSTDLISVVTSRAFLSYRAS